MLPEVVQINISLFSVKEKLLISQWNGEEFFFFSFNIGGIIFSFNLHLRTFFLFIAFREEGKEREILMWEKTIDWLPPICTWARNQTHNLCMCPDQGSNLQHSNQLSHNGQGEGIFLRKFFYARVVIYICFYNF